MFSGWNVSSIRDCFFEFFSSLFRRAVENLELRMRFSAGGKGFGVTSAAEAEFHRRPSNAPLKRCSTRIQRLRICSRRWPKGQLYHQADLIQSFLSWRPPGERRVNLLPGSSRGGAGPESAAASAHHPTGERLSPKPETRSAACRLLPAPRTFARLRDRCR